MRRNPAEREDEDSDEVIVPLTAADNKTAPREGPLLLSGFFDERGTARLPRAINAPLVKKRIRDVVRGGQHWNLPDLIKERLNPLLRGWGNYFRTGNSRMHFKSIDNYATYTLTIMIRKKHKKRSKGWRDHPPSWFHDYHGLFHLNKMVAIKDTVIRYARQVPS